jgi:chromosomal replication initiator protein
MHPQHAQWVTPVADRLVLTGAAPRPNRFAVILHVVAKASGITVEELLSTKRERRLARPRQVAMVLCRELTSASYPAIARVFRRDHSTVIHAQAAVDKAMTPELAAAMERLRNEVRLILLEAA